MLFGRKKPQENDDTILERDLNACVDFTLLDPRAGTKDIENLCNIAYKNKYYAVCVNPINVSTAASYINRKLQGSIKVVAVIGFPLGANTLETKVYEAKQAISDGADELDVVISISKAREGDMGYIKNELSRIVRCSKKRIVKAIIETCYFNRDEIIRLCKVCMKAKVDYIKTSTGFGIDGASPEVVNLIASTVDGKCLVKASGGIKTRSQGYDLIRAGARRLGTSREI